MKLTREQKKTLYLTWIGDLACSQGFYGRLLRQLHEDEEAMNALLEQDFRTSLDMVLWLEC